MDSDSKFRIFRRFGFLRTRLLLYRQDILREIEHRLNIIDGNDESEAATKVYLASRQADDARDNPQRKTLFQELEAELKRYGAARLCFTQCPVRIDTRA